MHGLVASRPASIELAQDKALLAIWLAVLATDLAAALALQLIPAGAGNLPNLEVVNTADAPWLDSSAAS